MAWEHHMKLLLVSRRFDKSGGISRYCVELAERFVKEHETHLLTTDYDYMMPNLIVHKKPMIKSPFLLQIASNAYYNRKYIGKINVKYDIDVIYSQGAESPLCDVLRMPSCHKEWVKQYNKGKGRRFSVNPLDYVVLPIEKHVLEKGCKKIVANSNRIQREILSNYNISEDKIVTIYNGVNLKMFGGNHDKRMKTRKLLGIGKNDLVLMFAGHEFGRKGLQHLISSLPDLSDDIKLLVVGNDKPNHFINLARKLNVKNMILFTGLSRNIENYYAASDIFVFPTLYEPFGFVILEAMASGLPVVASELAGASELITDGNEGFLLEDPTDPAEIADKINMLLDSPNMMMQMGRNGKRTAEEHSWDAVAKKMLEVYEEVLRY